MLNIRLPTVHASQWTSLTCLGRLVGDWGQGPVRDPTRIEQRKITQIITFPQPGWRMVKRSCYDHREWKSCECSETLLFLSYQFCIYFVDIMEIQRLTRESLDRVWRDYMSNDWISPDKAHRFPVDIFYLDLRWIKKVKEALRTVKESMTSIYDVLGVVGPQTVNIPITG